MRNQTAKLLAPILKRTGFRFSKDYRHGKTWLHRFVYRYVDVVSANLRADGYGVAMDFVDSRFPHN